MTFTTVKYKEWEFEVDRVATLQTYKSVLVSGAEDCVCNDCKNYVAYRDCVFPDEIKQFFDELGIDFKKEEEIVSWTTLPNGLHHIGGWFHFKGRIISGNGCKVSSVGNGYTIDLTPVTENLSIGFAEADGRPTFFQDEIGLVEVRIGANIPWVIDKSLEVND